MLFPQTHKVNTPYWLTRCTCTDYWLLRIVPFYNGLVYKLYDHEAWSPRLNVNVPTLYVIWVASSTCFWFKQRRIIFDVNATFRYGYYVHLRKQRNPLHRNVHIETRTWKSIHWNPENEIMQTGKKDETASIVSRCFNIYLNWDYRCRTANHTLTTTTAGFSKGSGVAQKHLWQNQLNFWKFIHKM